MVLGNIRTFPDPSLDCLIHPIIWLHLGDNLMSELSGCSLPPQSFCVSLICHYGLVINNNPTDLHKKLSKCIRLYIYVVFLPLLTLRNARTHVTHSELEFKEWQSGIRQYKPVYLDKMADKEMYPSRQTQNHTHIYTHTADSRRINSSRERLEQTNGSYHTEKQRWITSHIHILFYLSIFCFAISFLFSVWNKVILCANSTAISFLVHFISFYCGGEKSFRSCGIHCLQSVDSYFLF